MAIRGKRRALHQPGNANELYLPDGTLEEIDPEHLLLDPMNLRLLEKVPSTMLSLGTELIGTKSIQDKMQDLLAKDSRADVEGLTKSILSLGFLRHERLIVARYDGARFLVLEGNRRLSAVRLISSRYPKLTNLPELARETLGTLPCYVLNGSPIGDSDELLGQYRKSSEIYVGIRHLTGIKSWDPASRYEFQARLIESGWSIEKVADSFARRKNEVTRDLMAHYLYRDFRSYELGRHLNHTLTYNAFNEASRAQSISQWLGWSANDLAFRNAESKSKFFDYLIHKLKMVPTSADESQPIQDESAETIVRNLRKML